MLFGTDVEQVRTRYGRMFVPTADTVIGRSLRLYGEWAEHEISAVSSLLRDGPAIVDVGANMGTHSLAFAARFPSSTIFAIEPQPLPFALLCGSALVNGYSNIVPYAIACGDRIRLHGLSLEYGGVDWNVGTLSLDGDAPVDGGYPVLVSPLDRLLAGREVQFIKIDVEGMEASVLRGAIATLRRCRPLIYFEVLEASRLAESLDILLRFAYRLYWLETAAFNLENYNGAQENLWSRHELGVLAVPPGMPDLDLVGVTGLEVELPAFADPLQGYDPKGTGFGASGIHSDRFASRQIIAD